MKLSSEKLITLPDYWNMKIHKQFFYFYLIFHKYNKFWSNKIRSFTSSINLLFSRSIIDIAHPLKLAPKGQNTATLYTSSLFSYCKLLRNMTFN